MTEDTMNEQTVGVTRPVSRGRGSVALILALGAVTAIPPLATDMYVPGMPAMAEEFAAPDVAVQLTLMAFLFGIGLGQLIIGPLSDAHGRRGLLLWGTVGYVIFSFICAVAPSIPVLIGARFVQGVFGAAGMVLARAVVADRFERHLVPRYFAWLALILGVAPIVAPVIGGLILGFASWRIIFVVLAVMGLVMIAGILLFVPETLPADSRHASGGRESFRAMGQLARRVTVVRYILISTFTSAALFAYISGATFVFQEDYGLSETGYGIMFGVNAFGMVLAGISFGRLSRRFSIDRLLAVGVLLSLAGAGILLVAWLVGQDGLVVAWVAFAVFMVGLGISSPAVLTGAQHEGADAAGAVSALMGGSQFLLASLAVPLVGILGNGIATLAAVCFGASVLAAIPLVALPGRR